VLQNQLRSLNAKPLTYIPLSEIKERIAILTDAVNRNEAFDEYELDHLLQCMEVNEEYIQEKQEKEKQWREKIYSYAQECLIEQMKFIPPDIYQCTLSMLITDKNIPVALAKRFMSKKCLWLIRMAPSYISKLHYAELQGKYSVEGNNLDIVEILAIYACVPVKFPNDGNGKKALWRKSLEETAKKIITSKENNTLTAALIRNPAYKSHIGTFTSTELYNPETLNCVDDNTVIGVTDGSISKSTVIGVTDGSISKSTDPLRLISQDEVNNPLHSLGLATKVLETSSIIPMATEEKINIKSQLENILLGRSRRSRSDGK
jgi:hypothetical protein